MKDKLIKYAAMIAALVIGGEGYLVLEELEQLRNTADSVIEITQKAVSVAGKLEQGVSRLRGDVNTLSVTADSTRSKCVEAGGNAVEITTELKEIRKQLEELRRKLRLSTQVFQARTDTTRVGSGS